MVLAFGAQVATSLSVAPCPEDAYPADASDHNPEVCLMGEAWAYHLASQVEAPES